MSAQVSRAPFLRCPSSHRPPPTSFLRVPTARASAVSSPPSSTADSKARPAQAGLCFHPSTQLQSPKFSRKRSFLGPGSFFLLGLPWGCWAPRALSRRFHNFKDFPPSLMQPSRAWDTGGQRLYSLPEAARRGLFSRRGRREDFQREEALGWVQRCLGPEGLHRPSSRKWGF